MGRITAYWWEPESGTDINLGDHINKVIIEACSGKEVVRAERNNCDLVAIGSVLWKALENAGQTKKLHVWGSGLMAHWDYKSKYAYKNVEFCAVRGNFTAAVVGLPDSLPKGDPGLLISDVLPFKKHKKYKYGIIPHHKNMEDENVLFLLENLKDSVLVDFRNPDYKKTLELMNSCEFIISSAMHGLIIADSYGIPNMWMHTNEIHRGNRFKFYDYFSSVGRLDKQVDVKQWVAQGASENAFREDHVSNIRACKDGLLKAFPKF
ncbi:polysaccharide pyruvyl transferase family protein [Pseudomonas sp. P1.8]|jgi:hypothetical protein|uniref:polysaccharide pyruvyl transferase family protein n=1 Tax=Pseudomonas sp. P1.8 TaxID=1699310 RepID=UPI00069E813E|nr:polysaccharide pyruvyl transferase family protein [Pseudomonas sp. P1.8]